MKRFYTTAEIDHEPEASAYRILLDGRVARTPRRAPLLIPCRPLAEAVAAEWDEQPETFSPAAMHLTGLAITAIDRVAPDPAPVVEAAVSYAETDLVCYRTESPRALADREHAAWQPLVDWVAQTYSAPLVVTHGVLPVPQPAHSLASLRRAVAEMDPMRLTALRNATEVLGSLVLGLALARGHLDSDDAIAAAHVDEDYQIERWGEDAEAAIRRRHVNREIAETERFLRLLDAS